MEIPLTQLPPGDPRLVDAIVGQLKSKGIFDKLRKECLADVDTKPAFLNLRQRVDGQVKKFLDTKTWKTDLNKNQLRDGVRKNIQESGILDSGIDAIITQIVNPKIKTLILPYVEDTVYGFLQIDKPKRDIREFDIPPPMIGDPYQAQAPGFHSAYPPYSEPSFVPKKEELKEESEPSFGKIEIQSSIENKLQEPPSQPSEVVAMETDVISSGDDDILNRNSPNSAGTQPHIVKIEEENAVDSFDTARSKKDDVVGAVERLTLKEESSPVESIETKEREGTAKASSVHQSLDSISSNSSGLSFSPLSGKKESSEQQESTSKSTEEGRTSPATPLADEKSEFDLSSPSEQKTWEASSLPKDLSSSDRITIASFTGTTSSEQIALFEGTSPISRDNSQESVEKECSSTSGEMKESKAVKEEKSEGEITSSTTSSPMLHEDASQKKEKSSHKSSSSSKDGHRHRSRSKEIDKHKSSHHSKSKDDKDRHRSKSKHDDHSSHRDKDKHHRKDRDDDKDRDKHSSKSHHHHHHGSSSTTGGSSGKSEDKKDNVDKSDRHHKSHSSHGSSKHSSKSHHRDKSKGDEKKSDSKSHRNEQEHSKGDSKLKNDDYSKSKLSPEKKSHKSKEVRVLKEDDTFLKQLMTTKKESPKKHKKEQVNEQKESINKNLRESEKKEHKNGEIKSKKNFFESKKNEKSPLQKIAELSSKNSKSLKREKISRKRHNSISSSSSSGSSSDSEYLRPSRSVKKVPLIPSDIVTESNDGEVNIESSDIVFQKVTIPLFSMAGTDSDNNEKRLKKNSKKAKRLAKDFKELFGNTSDEESEFEGFAPPKKISKKKIKAKESYFDSDSDMEISVLQFCNSDKPSNDFEGFGNSSLVDDTLKGEKRLRNYLSQFSNNSPTVQLEELFEINSDTELGEGTTFFASSSGAEKSINGLNPIPIVTIREEFAETPDSVKENNNALINGKDGLSTHSESSVDSSSNDGGGYYFPKKQIISTMQHRENTPLDNIKMNETTFVSSNKCSNGPISKKRRILNAVQSEIEENLAKSNSIMNSYAILTPDEDRSSNDDLYHKVSTYIPLSPASDSSADDLKKQIKADATEIKQENRC